MLLASVLILVIFVALAGPRWFGPDFHGPRFKPCPASPNCVSSRNVEAGDALHRIEPVRPGTAADPALLQQRARDALLGLGRTRIVEDEPGYLRAEARSRLFGFIDDVELSFGPGRIDVRSASRLGYSDLGVNRARAERLRAALEPDGGS